MTKIAICTINWNRKEDTIEFLASLKKLDTSNLQVRIFLVTNKDLLKKVRPFKGLTFSQMIKRQNRGSAGGYNDGAKAALLWGANYILLVNNDILFKSPNLLKSLIESVKSDRSVGAVSPKLLFAPGFEFHKNRYSKADIGRVIWYAGGHFDWNNINSVHRGIDEVDTGRYDVIEETGFVSGSAVLVKAEIFQKGLFWDEELFAYLDDNDWQERVRRAGYKFCYDGRVAVFHKVNRTAGTGSGLSDYYLSRNRLVFGLRYASLRTKIALLREAIRILTSGRPRQKQGVRDFLLGKVGEKTPA